MRKYWSILRKYKRSLLTCPILVLIFVVCETTQPYLMSRIIDDGVMPGDLNIIFTIGLIMIGVSIISLVANISNVYISSRTSTRFGSDLRAEMFKKIQLYSFNEIDKFSPASLITRLTSDVSRIQNLLLMSMRVLFRSPMMMIMASIYIFQLNRHLALIILIAVPFMGICMYLLLSKAFPFFIQIQQKIDKLNSVVRENLLNIRVVKSFVTERQEQKKFNQSSEELSDTVIKASNIIVTVFPLMQFVMNASIISILWFGGKEVSAGQLKVGELISFVNYFMQILMALMMISMIVMVFARAAASSKRIIEVLNTESTLADSLTAKQIDQIVTNGEVQFKNVYFRYSNGENDVLKNINFHIHAGETIAIVGATGSAKTSLLQLIPRLYDVSQGEIRIDGVNVKDYTLDELHKKIGMVLQVNELFSGTIADNLRWGRADASWNEIEEVAKVAQAHEFIMSFASGYNTILGRGGVNLSGGQKQRICIARALLRKPRILILDDSTSAVDTETEIKIREGLRNMLQDTTVFMVTQRVNVMQSVDRVIILEDGELADIGKPAELLEKSHLYQEIYNSQQIVF